MGYVVKRVRRIRGVKHKALLKIIGVGIMVLVLLELAQTIAIVKAVEVTPLHIINVLKEFSPVSCSFAGLIPLKGCMK